MKSSVSGTLLPVSAMFTPFLGFFIIFAPIHISFGMTVSGNKIYVFSLTAIVIAVTIFLWIKGYSYYATPLEERFYHPDHTHFKPGGIYGHGLGIVGTLLIFIGVTMYIARKRYKFLARFGRLKYWLEFHIFLCSLGPVLVLFHTAFKFGGIVSVAFWSMVAVVVSGIIGRFIYIQIPRSIEGRELSLHEVRNLKAGLEEQLSSQFEGNPVAYQAVMTLLQGEKAPVMAGFSMKIVQKYFADKKTIASLKKVLKSNLVPSGEIKSIVALVTQDISLSNRIERLQTMQALFRYWHVAHLPFALIMLIVLIIHVGITLVLGYKWIF